jgi:hypothetical protein
MQSKKDNSQLIRVDKHDKFRLEEKSRLNQESMPKVINRLLEEEKIIGSRNSAYIQDIAEKTGASFNEVLNRIIIEHEEQTIMDDLNASYSALQSDQSTWTEVREERRIIQSGAIDNITKE